MRSPSSCVARPGHPAGQLEDRKQLDRGDAGRQVRNLLDQTGVAAGLVDGRPSQVLREPRTCIVMTVSLYGRCSGQSPSQSYCDGSATTLLIATAVLSPGSSAAARLYPSGTATASAYGSSSSFSGSNLSPRSGAKGPCALNP